MEQDHPCRNHHRIGGLDGDSDMEEREMTVSELIEALKEMPQDSEVSLNIKIRDDIYPNLKNMS